MIGSAIEWTHDTVNVVEGCTQVDEDCRACYAMGIAARFAQDQVTARREEDGAPMATKPGHYAGLARLSPGRRLPQWTGKVRLRPDVLDSMFWRLLRARSPRRQFLCSMGDIFHAEVPDAFLDDVFARIAILESRRAGGMDFGRLPIVQGGADLTPPHAQDHPILMLTKRPERAAEYTNAPDVEARIEAVARRFIQRARGELQDGAHPRSVLGEATPAARLRKGVSLLTGFSMPAWPLRSVALITSAGTQAGADARVPWLLRCKAAIRGVSCEPMTGPVDFSRLTIWRGSWEEVSAPRTNDAKFYNALRGELTSTLGASAPTGPRLDWIILGGESGDISAEEDRRPRPCELAWMDDVAAQCRAAGTALFVKQLGHVLAAKLGREGKGGKLEDLPPHLRIREFPRIQERA